MKSWGGRCVAYKWRFGMVQWRLSASRSEWSEARPFSWESWFINQSEMLALPCSIAPSQVRLSASSALLLSKPSADRNSIRCESQWTDRQDEFEFSHIDTVCPEALLLYQMNSAQSSLEGDFQTNELRSCRLPADWQKNNSSTCHMYQWRHFVSRWAGFECWVWNGSPVLRNHIRWSGQDMVW
jgi:hypothetical protein